MKNLQIIWKMASAGDRTAQQKLMSGAEQEIRFLCTALCPDSIIREKAFGESMNIISSGISGCGSLDEFTFLVRKKTAEICMRNTGERIVPDDIPQQDISLSGNMDMISLPAPGCRVTVSCFSSRRNPHGTLNHSSGSAKRRPPCQKTIISQ